MPPPNCSPSAATAPPRPTTSRRSISVDQSAGEGDEPSDGRRRGASRTRNRIFDAATELFALRGYDATTTDDIASGAGITVPGLYLHFRSKAELRQAIGRRSFASYRLAQPLGGRVDQRHELAEIACAFSAPGQRVARRLAIELDLGAWRQPELVTSLRDYHRAVRRNVASTLGPGDERELPALVFLMLFMGIAHLDTIDPSLVGSRAWSDFLTRVVPQLLR